jgi:hypothetical protein
MIIQIQRPKRRRKLMKKICKIAPVVAAAILFGSGIQSAVADPIAVGNDTVEFVRVAYDYPTAGQSTWFYTVTSGVQPAISHVTWEANLGCLTVSSSGTWDGNELNAGAGTPVIGTDATTGLTGVKFDQGFGDNEVRNYYFTVNGNYDEAQITFASKAGSGFETVEITGPTLTCGPATNNPPVANDDTVSGSYNDSTTINVLGNDSDPDGDNLSNPTIVEGPSSGSVVVNADGTITYTPNSDFFGTDTFSYEISDGKGGTDQADVTITIACPVNRPPVANDDSYDATEDNQLLVDVPGIIVNDTDPDEDDLTVSLPPNTGTANGSLTLNPDGSFTYTPSANFCGTDGFDYTLSDGKGGTDEAHVTINVACVNDPPTAGDDSGRTQENTSVNIPVLGNDADNPAENDPISISSVDSVCAQGGSMANNGDGSLGYTPLASFAGVDTCTYTICDDPSGQPGLTISDKLCDTATVTVTVDAKYNRSIEVDLVDFTLSGTALNGNFTVQNVSGDGKIAQVDEFKITAEYNDGKTWKPVAVQSCEFNPASPDTLADTKTGTYTFSCQMANDVSAYPVRVIANVHIFGRIKGSHIDGWYWERLAK